MSLTISTPRFFERRTYHGSPDKRSDHYICFSSLRYVEGVFEIDFLVRKEMFWAFVCTDELELSIQPSKSEGVYTSDVNIILTFLSYYLEEGTRKAIEVPFLLQASDKSSKKALKALLKNRALKIKVTVIDDDLMQDHDRVYNIEMERSFYEELQESARLLRDFRRQRLV